MKILILSNIEWADNNAFGNTISNWFSGMRDVEFASVYRRSSLPSNCVCSSYYTISFQDCVKNLIGKEKIGKEFTLEEDKKSASSNNNLTFEKRLIRLFHKHSVKFIYTADRIIFSLRGWDNNKFKKYIETFSPNVIFLFIEASTPIRMILERVKELSPSSAVVGFIADDVYGNAESSMGKKEIERQIKQCDLLYGASEILCREYGEIFKRDISVLYKGCMFDGKVEKKNNESIRMIYAGNLYYGREKTLIALANSLVTHNKDASRKIVLDIYTSTEVKDNIKNSLNIEGTCELHGSLPYTEIKKVMTQSDIVLHVESFDRDQAKIVRYSFSTKIIDCLQSCSVIMGIGPADVASMDYISKIPGAIAVTDLDEITNVVNSIDGLDLYDRAVTINIFAKKNHNITEVQSKLAQELSELLGRGSQ